MADKTTYFVHQIHHGDGRYTVTLLARWSSFFTPDPPSAHAQGLTTALRALHETCGDHFRDEDDRPDRFRWDSPIQLRRARISVHPSTHVGAMAVLGRKTVPLTVTYGLSPLGEGGCRLVVPRFGASLVIEDEAMAQGIIQQQLSAWLAGSEAESLFNLRAWGEEGIEPWKPSSPFWRPRRHQSSDEYGVLYSVAEDWLGKAARSRLDPVVEVFQPSELNDTYDRFPPASILLVGRQGVGKTSWVRALAHYFLRWRRDDSRDEPPRLWVTSADRLMAGMSYLGQWEERCLEVLEELSYEGDYLYVGRLRPIVERRGHSSIGELWVEAVEDGRMSLIAECAPEELEICRRLLPGLVRQMKIVQLEEPPLRRLPDHIRQYASRKAKHVDLREGALRTMVHLLDAYQRHEVFPGKAFRFVDVLEQEAADPAEETGEPTAASSAAGRSSIHNEATMIRSFCRWSGLPEELISDRQGRGESDIADRLSAGVIGQPDACAAAARILARFKAGVHDPGKPLGTLLFVGPTGVGKTELAKQLATYMFGDEKRMLRFDMSELQSAGSARRLLEVGKGVRSLAQSLRRQPLSLVLFDEIEKAHPEVFDLLLGVLGEGRLTDSEGKFVDFRMSILVMTSNLGVSEKDSPGFGDRRQSTAGYRKAVQRHFRPELVNRIDEIVPFRNLDLEDVGQIVELMFHKARRRPGFQQRNLSLRLEPGAKSWLARNGLHATRGARPLQRLIEEAVLTPLAIRMAEDPSLKDRTIYVVDDPSTAVPSGSESLVVG